MRKLGLRRRELLAGPAVLLGGLLEEKQSGQKDEAWRKLLCLRRAVGRGDQDFARNGAHALKLLLAVDNSSEALRIRSFCDEVLRDCGEPISHRVVEAWARMRDPLNLTSALLVHANFLRMRTEPDGDFSEAMRYVRCAREVARGLIRGPDTELKSMLLHQTVLMEYRLTAVYGRNPGAAGRHLDLLRKMASDSHSQRTEIETLREEIGQLTLLYEFGERRRLADLVRAEDLLEAGRDVFSGLADSSAMNRLGVIRPEIELRFLKGDRARGKELLQEYRNLIKEQSNPYHIRVLGSLEAKYLGRPVRPPASRPPNPAMSYFYLEHTYLERI